MKSSVRHTVALAAITFFAFVSARAADPTPTATVSVGQALSAGKAKLKAKSAAVTSSAAGSVAVAVGAPMAAPAATALATKTAQASAASKAKAQAAHAGTKAAVQKAGSKTETLRSTGRVVAQVLNINTAPLDKLEALPGVGDMYAQKVIDGRPYKATEELVSKKVVPKAVYQKISKFITVK
jgi:DNA uptake protein ComE-like DNA-binding protein